MGAAGEEVKGFGVDGAVAALLQQAEVPGQGGRVAGDVDDAPGRHLCHGLDDVGADALAGRVYDDDIGPRALRRQPHGRLARVGAEKARVFDAVALRVLLSVGNGRLNDLHADGRTGLPGQTERDGAGAAVEVQHRLRPVELRQLQGAAVEPLRLVAVHLIEGPGR